MMREKELNKRLALLKGNYNHRQESAKHKRKHKKIALELIRDTKTQRYIQVGGGDGSDEGTKNEKVKEQPCCSQM